ncbi:MAG: DMT family transporter [Paracoccaceae bacterium]
MKKTSANLRGATLMTLAMLGFAIEDLFIKLMAEILPTWQILAVLGGGGALVFAAMTKASGQPLWTRAYLKGPVLLRNVAEIVGTVGFVTAIALTPISQASAILQATPLVVTLGAALFLGERVGPRRWSAVMIGFLGVLLVIRPGTEGFDAKSLFAVQGVIGLAVRDVVTRRVSEETSSLQLSFLAFLTLIPSAAILAQFSDRPFVPTSFDLWVIFAVFILIAAAAYLAIVASMRVGEVSFVTPFRYSRIVFALIIGVTVFRERPDFMMLTGVAVIVGAGIYVIWRERLAGAQAQKDGIPGS